MGNKSKSKKRVKASTNEAKTTCPECGEVLTYDMRNTAEECIKFHMALDHGKEEADVKVEPTAQKYEDRPPQLSDFAGPKTRKQLDEWQKDHAFEKLDYRDGSDLFEQAKKAEAVEEAPRQGVPERPKQAFTCSICKQFTSSARIGILSHEKACRKKAVQTGSLEAVRNLLEQLSIDIYDTVEETREQAKKDAQFFDEVDSTLSMIKNTEEEIIPMFESIGKDYLTPSIQRQYDTTMQTLAEAKARLAELMLDPRYGRGKGAAKQVILDQAVEDAQEEASQHNNEKRQIPVNAASNWIAENATRFDRMYHGELWVPSRARLFFIHEDLCPCTMDRDASCTCEGDYPKYGSLPFMRDTLWKVQSTAKEKFDLKKVSKIRPEHIRDVWPEVFKQQMERYSFKETEEFSVDTTKAVVGDSGEIKMVPATFTETARVPFTEWSSMMLNSILKIHKECKGEDIMSVLTRRNLAGKDGSIEVLPEAFVASWFVKTNVQLTGMQHAWNKAVNDKKKQ